MGRSSALLAAALLATAAVTATAAFTSPAATGAPTPHTAASAGVAITAIYFDSPGPDTGTNRSLNAEWVQLKNTARRAKTITGWTLRDTSRHVYRFPRFTLKAGATVKVHTGSGRNTVSNLYWNHKAYIWNNTGDTATLRNAHGILIDRCHYTEAADPRATC